LACASFAPPTKTKAAIKIILKITIKIIDVIGLNS
jgi:hypothetical protein